MKHTHVPAFVETRELIREASSVEKMTGAAWLARAVREQAEMEAALRALVERESRASNLGRVEQ